LAKFEAEISRPNGFHGFFLDMIFLITGAESRLSKYILKKQTELYELNKAMTKNLSLKKVKVHYIEIEWLERNLTTFLRVVISDELTFDTEMVQNLLLELQPFWYPLFTFIFTPFMIYFGLVTYYFCFVLTDAYESRDGFTEGSNFAIAIRFLILVLSAYQFLIEYLSLKEITRRSN
jgi:hypothetical protein